MYSHDVTQTLTNIIFSYLRMKTVDLGEKGKALLVRENGEYSAVGHKCTHFGAPLAKGDLCEGRVRCPWHGACFNIKTGDIEDFPGLDSLPKFEVGSCLVVIHEFVDCIIAYEV